MTSWSDNSIRRKRARIRHALDRMLERGKLEALDLYKLARQLEALHEIRDHDSG